MTDTAADQVAGPSTRLIGMAMLAKMAYRGADFSALSASLMKRASDDPNDANALLDLSVVLQLAGHRTLGVSVQREALALTRVFRLLPRSGTSGLHVLVIVGDGDIAENNVIELLLENANITLDFYYFNASIELNEQLEDRYDVVFVAISEYERNRKLLADVGAVLRGWRIPVLNRPEKIDHLSRDRVTRVLTPISAYLAPTTGRITRDELGRLGESGVLDEVAGFSLPVIVRPVDSHKGIGLARIAELGELKSYLLDNSDSHFYVSSFIDYRSADGLYRKYRIVLIDGVPYLSHLAISSHWMVHYQSAGMSESIAKQAEEAASMSSFKTGFAHRHAAAFKQIATELGLEYVGLDCGELPDGRLVVFEFDSSMTVHAMDPEDQFAYKQPNMLQLFDAFEALLRRKCRGHIRNFDRRTLQGPFPIRSKKTEAVAVVQGNGHIA